MAKEAGMRIVTREDLEDREDGGHVGLDALHLR